MKQSQTQTSNHEEALITKAGGIKGAIASGITAVKYAAGAAAKYFI